MIGDLTRRALYALGSHGTRYIGMLWGEALPFYYVSEYPKSGGTWLAQMIGDYLQVPFPQHYRLPLAHSSVVHNHWRYSPRLHPVVYLYRDGRDVVISTFHYAIAVLEATDDREVQRFVRSIMGKLVAVNPDRESLSAVLPEYIRRWSRRSVGSRVSWMQHVTEWAFDRPGVTTVSYEELLGDTRVALTRVVEGLTDKPADLERIDWTVEKYSFQRQTGRARGTEDKRSFHRKGVAGDWKTYFDRAAGRAFDEVAGDLLVELGYEQDRTWWESLPEKVILPEVRDKAVGE